MAAEKEYFKVECSAIHNQIWGTNAFLEPQKYIHTTDVSWCFPSNGKNSRMHTSKLPEFTFSNQTYIASSAFVLRAYFVETNTEGLPPKPCKLHKLNDVTLILIQKRMFFDKIDSSTAVLNYNFNSGAPVAQRAAKRSHILLWETKGNPWVDFLMAIVASGIVPGRVRTTATATTTESRNMAAIMGCQRHAALVYCVLLWYWTSMLIHRFRPA